MPLDSIQPPIISSSETKEKEAKSLKDPEEKVSRVDGLQGLEREGPREMMPFPEEKEEIKEEIERPREVVELKVLPSEAPKVSLPVPSRPPPPLAKSETLQKIEDILSERLEETFLAMEPSLQRKFKAKGEEIASKIEVLLKKAKVKIKKILKMIRDWLEMIPAVNRFFLEQEAKIKTDRILKIKN